MKRLQKEIMLILVCAAVAVTAAACSGKTFDGERTDEIWVTANLSYKNIGNVGRTLPEVSNGGLARYPEYGTALSGAAQEEKELILAENKTMFDYDAMDAVGNLYKGGQPLGQKLFKHTAASGLYYGDISDEEPAVARRVRINPAVWGNNMTGLYAPPGEVVTILLSEEDAARGMRVEIGQGTQRGGQISIPTNKNYTRMPNLKKHMQLNAVENYVGSPLGGPIYLFNENDKVLKGESYEVTILGAVEMPCYIAGSTSDEEWLRLAKSSAPVFDLETYAGVRLTMPSKFIRKKTAGEMRRVAEFWDKAAQLSNTVANGYYRNIRHVVSMVFDTYVPAGAAVAFVGADFCVLPTDWGGNAVNYETIMVSGAWGCLHEFNHHHQGWGAGNGGEVTNNVINAMTYILYTNIGAMRTETGGLGGWNWVTDASASLAKTLGFAENGKQDLSLSMYVNLLHAFGVDAVVDMAKNSRAQTQTAWFQAACDATGYDMTYYLTDLCGFEVDSGVLEAVRAKGLPMFVPIANRYQTGRNVLVTGVDGERYGKDVVTGKPFYVAFGEEKILDMQAYTVAPKDIEWKIKEVGVPESGTIRPYTQDGRTVENKYVYTPSKNAGTADRVRVTYSLTSRSNPEMKIEDVTITLSFLQDVAGVSGEIYQNPGYGTIAAAIGDDFEKKAKPLEAVRYGYAGTADQRENTITAVTGKILPPSGGEYWIYLKGDDAAALYTGATAQNLTLSSQIDSALKQYDKTLAGSFFKVTLTEGKPLYFKLYVLNKGGKGSSRMGWADLTQVEGATPIEEDASGGEVLSNDVPIVDIPSSYVFYADANVFVPARTDYQSERIYQNPFTAAGFIEESQEQMSVTLAPKMLGSAKAEYMLDGNPATYAHTQVGKFPAEFIISLGYERTFNTVRLRGRQDATARGRIKEYQLLAGNSLYELATVSEGTLEKAFIQKIDFQVIKASYLKLIVTDGYAVNGERYVAISDFNIGMQLTTQEVVSHKGKDLIYKGDWSQNTYGSYLNGGAAESRSGSMEVNFHGTAFGLFAKVGKEYGKAEISLDGGKWQEVNFFAETESYGKMVYAICDLADGYHKIVLRTKADQLINVDYMGFAVTTPPPEKGLGLWWIAIGIAIFAASAGIGVCAFFATRYYVKRKERIAAKKATAESGMNRVEKNTLTAMEKTAETEKTSAAVPVQEENKLKESAQLYKEIEKKTAAQPTKKTGKTQEKPAAKTVSGGQTKKSSARKAGSDEGKSAVASATRQTKAGTVKRSDSLQSADVGRKTNDTKKTK